MAAVSVQDLVEHCGLEESWLEREITGRCFHDLSRYLSDWRKLAPSLNLSRTDVDDIERDNPRAEAKRESFLERWEQKSVKATYRALVDALLRIERVNDAKGVCQLLKGKVRWGNSEGGAILIWWFLFATRPRLNRIDPWRRQPRMRSPPPPQVDSARPRLAW